MPVFLVNRETNKRVASHGSLRLSHYVKHLHFSFPEPRQPLLITDQVAEIVRRSGFQRGWVLISLQTEQVCVTLIDSQKAAESTGGCPAGAQEEHGSGTLAALAWHVVHLPYRTVLPIQNGRLALGVEQEIALIAMAPVETAEVMVKAMAAI